MQAAIVPKSIDQDMWYHENNLSGGTYYHQMYGSNNRYYYDTNYTVEVGSRNVYALSVKDIIDYLNVPINGNFTDTDIWQMFWGVSTAQSSYNSWLRSAGRYENDVAYRVYGNYGYMANSGYRAKNMVRPAFQIDLSKIAYTKN